MAEDGWSTRELLEHVKRVEGLLRNWYAKNVSPLERVPALLEATVRILDQKVPAARAELARLETAIARIRAETPDIEAAQHAAQSRLAAITAGVEAAERASQAAITDSEERATAREAALSAEADARRLVLERDFAHQQSEAQAALADLTAQLARVQQKFDEFRAVAR